MNAPQNPTDSHLLVVLQAQDTQILGRRYTLDTSTVTTIGRHADNTIVVRCPTASRHHARFEKHTDGWWVIDTDSSSGTYVNDEHVRRALLKHGDRVRVGVTILRFIKARGDYPVGGDR